MPTDSTYPAVDIPDVDLWTFLFERKDRPYPDGKGKRRATKPESGFDVTAMADHPLQ